MNWDDALVDSICHGYRGVLVLLRGLLIKLRSRQVGLVLFLLLDDFIFNLKLPQLFLISFFFLGACCSFTAAAD